MIVEDSPTVRTLLCHIIERDSRLQLAALCSSAEEALDSIAAVAPDIVSMDIRLPGMNGLEATRRIMALHPTPIVVIADAVHDATLSIALNALKAGALTVVEKPTGPAAVSFGALAETIATQLFIMSQVPVIRQRVAPTRAPREAEALRLQQVSIVALAASTGGPPALASVLGALPPSFPAPILVVQHMGAAFMEGFALWLATQTSLKVRLAADNETPQPGIVYVAPGDRHLLVGPTGLLRLSHDPPLHSQRPAATLMFRSLARAVGAKGVGVVLTGMGEDGARGLLEMKEAGAFTIAEDESTSVVYGMPAAAARLGAVRSQLPLDAIGPRLVEMLSFAA